MKYFIIGVAVVVFHALLISVFVDSTRDVVVQYDCRLSEISPDFPPKVREQCRQLRAKSKL